MQVLIHFDGWNQRYDEWIDMMSDKIRPLVRHSGRKERKKPAKGVRGRRPGGHSSKATTIPLNMPYLNVSKRRKKLSKNILFIHPFEKRLYQIVAQVVSL